MFLTLSDKNVTYLNVIEKKTYISTEDNTTQIHTVQLHCHKMHKRI